MRCIAFPHPILKRGVPFLTSMHDRAAADPEWAWLHTDQGCELNIAHALQHLKPPAGQPHPFANEHAAVDAAIQVFFHERHGAIWVPTDALEALLVETDLDDTLPTSMFRLPQPAVYVAYGPRWRQALRPPDLHGMAACANADLAEAEPVGCYLLQSRVYDEPAQAWVRQIGVHQVFRTRCSDFDEDTSLMSGFSIGIDDEDAPVTDAIAKAWQAATHGTFVAGAQRLVDLLAKLVLYQQCADSRTQLHADHSTEATRLQRVAGKKAAKLERRLSRLYDWTELGPVALPFEATASPGMAPHWRRGHFRMQRHGPQHQLRKVIFILPTVVRADRLDAPSQPGT
nr:hypothetical protein [uncultured Caldimonas sp.]